jgi:hypothetical protein
VILFRDEHPMLACLGWCGHGPPSTWECIPGSLARENSHSAPARGPALHRPSPPGTTIRRRIIGAKMTQVNHAVRVTFRVIFRVTFRALDPGLASRLVGLWHAAGPRGMRGTSGPARRSFRLTGFA